jgi:hypothetical protein
MCTGESAFDIDITSGCGQTFLGTQQQLLLLFLLLLYNRICRSYFNPNQQKIPQTVRGITKYSEHGPTVEQ